MNNYKQNSACRDLCPLPCLQSVGRYPPHGDVNWSTQTGWTLSYGNKTDNKRRLKQKFENPLIEAYYYMLFAEICSNDYLWNDFNNQSSLPDGKAPDIYLSA